MLMRLRWHSGAQYNGRLCAVTEPEADAGLQPSNNCHCQKAQQQKLNLISNKRMTMEQHSNAYANGIHVIQ